MKAIVQQRYGAPEALTLQEVPQPTPPDHGMLVRVRASSVNPAEWYAVTGTPYVARPAMGLRRPKHLVPGADFSGTVEAVGNAVTRFQRGDEVFGGKLAAWAEYLGVRTWVVPKPANVSFEEAAATPTAGVTALQGLRDKGQLQSGQRVLINGASGGVGTFAVQIAKALGAEVTGVCSSRNVELVQSLGAKHVIDYTREDFTRAGERYDLLLDVAGNRSWRDLRRVLAVRSTLVLIGGPTTNPWLGPLGHLVRVQLAALRAKQRVVFFVAQFNDADFSVLGDMLRSGAVRPVIDRTYPLSEVAAALRYLHTGHAPGKVVLTL